MSGVNKVILVGRLSKDPEVKNLDPDAMPFWEQTNPGKLTQWQRDRDRLSRLKEIKLLAMADPAAPVGREAAEIMRELGLTRKDPRP